MDNWSRVSLGGPFERETKRETYKEPFCLHSNHLMKCTTQTSDTMSWTYIEWHIESLMCLWTCGRGPLVRTELPITPRVLEAVQSSLRVVMDSSAGPHTIILCMCVQEFECQGKKDITNCSATPHPPPFLSKICPPDSLMSSLLSANVPRGCRVYLTCPALRLSGAEECQGSSQLKKSDG